MEERVREALICGAGKIGRGFLGQLLHRSGYGLHFLDGAAAVVELLNREKRYRVDIAGRPEATEYIPVLSAHTLSDARGALDVLSRVDLMCCAVGAPNLVPLAKTLAPLLRQRVLSRPLDWLICENADGPGKTILNALLEGADPVFTDFCAKRLGLVETQVLRTGMPADAEIAKAEPLALKMHDWWTLPCDADAFRGPIPKIEGLQPKRNFGNELTRKIYTFNGLNGPISYLGYANGYRVLHESATAPELQPLFQQIMEESAHGLIAEFGFDREEHLRFQQLAWHKYRDPALADAIERNARDTARKLSPRERLLGPASLSLKHGRPPLGYAAAISAAIAYEGSDDAGTREVRELAASGGVEAVLAKFCGLKPDSELARLVTASYARKDFIVKKGAALA
jgi:mannitol-1-phosphate 5-dehydrogenase